MRVLVIGSSGMLGQMVTLYLVQRGFFVTDLSRTRRLRPQTVLLDVLDQNAFIRFLEEQDYNVIVNCAALLGRACDSHPAEATALNAWFPHFLEEQFRERKTKIIQISTDAVFSSSLAERMPFDLCSPDTFYGQTKMTGELHNKKDLTLRSAFWGPDQRQEGSGLMNWFLESTGTVEGYRNVTFNGVTSLECAKCIEEAIIRDVAGVYHLCARETLSKYDLLCLLRSTFGHTGVQIEPVDSPISARHLAEPRLSCKKTFLQMICELKHWMQDHHEDYLHYQNVQHGIGECLYEDY